MLQPRSKSRTVESLRNESSSSSSFLVVVGDGVTDMQTREDAAADYAIGFGVHKQREKVRAMCDVFVTSVEEFKIKVFDLFSEKKK